MHLRIKLRFFAFVKQFLENVAYFNRVSQTLLFVNLQRASHVHITQMGHIVTTCKVY